MLSDVGMRWIALLREEKGTGYFMFGGRPRWRNVDSSPSVAASRCCHADAPKGCWRLTQVRSAVSSC
ncbi:MAG: hypothetical protein LZF86_60001, partial [Nitrospira sp.]